MPKPVTLPRWADLAAPADIVNPPSGKKDSGWLTAEKPAHSYFNWYMNLVYQWTQYLDGLTGEALTWTAVHVFTQTPQFTRGITVDRGAAAGAGVAVNGGISSDGTTAPAGIAVLAQSNNGDGVYASTDHNASYAVRVVPGTNALGGVNATAPAAGLSSQYAVAGLGVALAPGIVGVSANFAGGAGVVGSSPNASATGVSATNSAGGTALLAQSTGAGTAVKGVTSAASALGGHFQALGTSGGAAVRAEALNPAGTAVKAEGLIDCTGNIQMLNTKELAYTTPRTEVLHIAVPTFQPGSNAVNSAMDNNGRWRSSNVSAYDLASTSVPLPFGATTSQFEFYLSNTDAVSRNFPYAIIQYAYTGLAPTITSIASGTIIMTAGSAGWQVVPAVLVAPSSPGGQGGHVLVTLQMPATASFSQALFEYCRCTYSLTNQTRQS